ncbi:hypothetical protein ACFQ9Q_19495 [Streptomyces virginiae]|uniref:hypothetical protein n=1 Tax=Streptomyces virginiae TaxID=1961 RepID=UPI0036C68F25
MMTRALVAMDTAACLRVDGDPGAATAMAAAVYDRLPPAHRTGLEAVGWGPCRGPHLRCQR